MLYKSKHTGDELREESEIARKAGLEVNELTTDEIHQMEPDSLPDVSGGFHYLSDDHLNPYGLMNALIAKLEGSGVEIIRNCAVENIVVSGNKAESIKTSIGIITFDQLVITAGFWSRDILKDLRIKLDLQPGKGYSFKVKHKKAIHFPALLSDANVAVTPINNELTQFGGGMEMGYPGYKIYRARVQQIIKSAGQFYPKEKGIEFSELSIWQGHRPCSFDGLPYIDRVNFYPNIFVGTGHSMMGVTLAPATGKLLSELISGEKTSLELKPFRVGR
jgi:D-amino-acid dehydrogenase